MGEVRRLFRLTRVYLSFRESDDARSHREGILDVDAPNDTAAVNSFLALDGAVGLDYEKQDDGTLTVLGEDPSGIFLVFTRPL